MLKMYQCNSFTCMPFVALTQMLASSRLRNNTNATPLLRRVFLSFTTVTLMYKNYINCTFYLVFKAK